MDEENDLEIVELLGYLRHRVEVWEDRASSCLTVYVRELSHALAIQTRRVIDQIEIDQKLEAEEVSA